MNYRVRDQPGYAALLHNGLDRHFGADNVFLAIIGPRRVGASDREDPDRDWGHRETAEALAAGIRVIPFVLDDVELSAPDNLPPASVSLSTIGSAPP